MYARVIGNCSNAKFKPFFEELISKIVQIKTDGWSGYSPFKKEYLNLVQESSGKKGGNFGEMHRCIMMLKAWLRGMHHSVQHLQNYLDEYCYRFNRSTMNGAIFDNLLLKTLNTIPFGLKI